MTLQEIEAVIAGSKRWTIEVADCRETMAAMPAESVDAIVCDPPYDLLSVSRNGSGHSAEGAGPYERHDQGGFMGMKWDGTGVAFRKETWLEALRVSKPGGHLLAFGGTRTYHRLACAIEDAGFEIRDTIDWVYSTGFPKSHDVSKAVDKIEGNERPTIRIKDWSDPRDKPTTAHYNGINLREGEPEIAVTGPGSETSEAWSGWGTALKPAHEPILVARKPLIGTVAENVLRYGTGALNIEASRVGTPAGKPWGGVHPNRGKFPGWPVDETLVPAPEPNVAGRWPPNLLLMHDPACRRNGTKTTSRHLVEHGPDQRPGAIFTDGSVGLGDIEEQVESWRCAPGCPVAELDRQSGRLTSGDAPGGLNRNGASSEIYGGGKGLFPIPGPAGSVYADSGGASRFFPSFAWEAEEVSFIYEPKADRGEREAGTERLLGRTASERTGREPGSPGLVMLNPDGSLKSNAYAGNSTGEAVRNFHPTVKPIALMAWLVRLVTPPGGLVTDPFAGSGTTGCAAVPDGFRFIGIEQSSEYADIARARIEHWSKRRPSERPRNVLMGKRDLAQRTLESLATGQDP